MKGAGISHALPMQPASLPSLWISHRQQMLGTQVRLIGEVDGGYSVAFGAAVEPSVQRFLKQGSQLFGFFRDFRGIFY